MTSLFFLSATFDYELIQQLTGLLLHARDNGQTPRSSTNVPITINIRNLNDNSPVFTQNNFGKLLCRA